MKYIIVFAKIIFTNILSGISFFHIKVKWQTVTLSTIGEGSFKPDKIFQTNTWVAKNTLIPLCEKPTNITLIWDIVGAHSSNKTSFIECFTKLTPNKILN